MLNQYPLWKNLLIVGVVVLGIIYAMPNFYPPDYAIQIQNEQGSAAVKDRELTIALLALEQSGVKIKSSSLIDGSALIRLSTADDQLKAQPLIQRALHDLNADFVVALNSAPTTPNWLRDLGAEPMKYGLDLRGGVHFLMEVDTASAVEDRLEGMEQDIKRAFRSGSDRVRYSGTAILEGRVLQFQFSDEDLRRKARRQVETTYPQFLVTEIEIPGVADGFALNLTMSDSAVREIEDFAVQQNLQTIRNRVNELGVAEPLVQRLGRQRIVVDLPGVQDTAEAKKILGKVATLEFRLDRPVPMPPEPARCLILTRDEACGSSET